MHRLTRHLEERERFERSRRISATIRIPAGALRPLEAPLQFFTTHPGLISDGTGFIFDAGGECEIRTHEAIMAVGPGSPGLKAGAFNRSANSP